MKLLAFVLLSVILLHYLPFFLRFGTFWCYIVLRTFTLHIIFYNYCITLFYSIIFILLYCITFSLLFLYSFVFLPVTLLYAFLLLFCIPLYRIPSCYYFVFLFLCHIPSCYSVVFLLLYLPSHNSIPLPPITL